MANQHLSLVMPNAVLANSTSTSTGNPIAAIILVEGTDKVTLTHLAVDGANNGLADCATNLVGIFFRNASGTIQDAAVRNIQLAPHSLVVRPVLACLCKAAVVADHE